MASRTEAIPLLQTSGSVNFLVFGSMKAPMENDMASTRRCSPGTVRQDATAFVSWALPSRMMRLGDAAPRSASLDGVRRRQMQVCPAWRVSLRAARPQPPEAPKNAMVLRLDMMLWVSGGKGSFFVAQMKIDDLNTCKL